MMHSFWQTIHLGVTRAPPREIQKKSTKFAWLSPGFLPGLLVGESRWTPANSPGRMAHSVFWQKFWELNVLNEITHLQYKEKLDDGIEGSLRYPLVCPYISAVKDASIPKDWHEELQVQSYVDTSTCRTAGCGSIMAEHVAAVAKAEELKKEELAEKQALNAKKRAEDMHQKRALKKTAQNDILNNKHDTSWRRVTSDFITDADLWGVVWDSADYSCGYNIVLVILYNMWKINRLFWSVKWHGHSKHLEKLAAGFDKMHNSTTTLKDIRTNMITNLWLESPSKFPGGKQKIYMSDLVPRIVHNLQLGTSGIACPLCSVSWHNAKLAEQSMLLAFTVVQCNQFRQMRT